MERPSQPSVRRASLADVAREIVEREGGPGASAHEVAIGLTIACEKLTLRFSRLVGQHGAQALLRRSVAVTARSVPWLAGVTAGSEPAWWDALRAALAAQPRDVALDGATQLIGSFVGILGNMIGEALVLRILDEVWPLNVRGDTKQEAP